MPASPIKEENQFALNLLGLFQAEEALYFLLSPFSRHLCSLGSVCTFPAAGSVYIYISALKSQLLIVEAGQVISD